MKRAKLDTVQQLRRSGPPNFHWQIVSEEVLELCFFESDVFNAMQTCHHDLHYIITRKMECFLRVTRTYQPNVSDHVGLILQLLNHVMYGLNMFET